MIKEIKINNKKIETIEKNAIKKTRTRERILNRQSKASNYKSWSEATIKLFKADNKKNTYTFSIDEVSNIMQKFLDKYLEYHPTIKYELKNSQGKSSFEYKENGYDIEIITYQNGNQIVSTLLSSDINYMEDKIKYFLKNKNEIKSKVIALCWAEEVKGEIISWKDFFSNRKYHNYFTKCLSYLREIGIIEYEGGIVRLKQKIYKE